MISSVEPPTLTFLASFWEWEANAGTKQLSNLARVDSWVAAMAVPAALIVTDATILTQILIIPWQSSHKSPQILSALRVRYQLFIPILQRRQASHRAVQGLTTNCTFVKYTNGYWLPLWSEFEGCSLVGVKTNEQRISDHGQVAQAFALICDLPPGWNVTVIVYSVTTEDKKVKDTWICITACEPKMLA